MPRWPFVLLPMLVPLPSFAAVDLQVIASNLPFIVDIQHAGDGSGRLFLVSQQGQILIHDGTIVLPTPLLDISGLVRFSGEEGLLGLAFHPNYRANGFFYVYYNNKSNDTVIARYRVSSVPNIADPASAAILLTEPQPFGSHKGGQVAFGPDGFLYIALGDGGSGGDPLNNGQRLDTVLGKILRIDVDSASPYAIPPTNPFVGIAGARGEIWVYGLRNPWRFSVDRLTGDMFIADVGQNSWEEVSFHRAGTSGQNYGWRRMEGRHCFDPSSGCDTGSLTVPMLEYSHTLGCSITGGSRYRGAAMSSHLGRYFFADYCTGRIWGAIADSSGTWTATQLLGTTLNVTTFGVDETGEIYIAHYAASGSVYRLVSAADLPTLTITRVGRGKGLVRSSPVALECGDICGAQLASGTTINLTATPEAGSTFAGWSGDADCEDGVVTLSVNRTCTARFGLAFTDDSLVAGVTIVRAVHVTELRSRIDALRADVGLAPFEWTVPAPSTGSTVRAAHITELRTALDEVYVAAGKSVTYTDPMLSAGTTVKAVHITEIRNAVVALE